MKPKQENPKPFTDKLISLNRFIGFTLAERQRWQKCFVCGKWASIFTPDKIPAIQGYLFCYKHYKEYEQKKNPQGELF